MDVATELDGVLNAQEKTAAVVPRDDGSTSGAAAELAATILWGPCDTTVLRGARVVLESSYAGNPEPRVQWLRAVRHSFTAIYHLLGRTTRIFVTRNRAFSRAVSAYGFDNDSRRRKTVRSI